MTIEELIKKLSQENDEFKRWYEQNLPDAVGILEPVITTLKPSFNFCLTYTIPSIQQPVFRQRTILRLFFPK
jgi:hypothetical protein